MFGKFLKLMQDESVRALMTHPKFQQLMKDPEFQALVMAQQRDKLAAHPKFSALMKDPELAGILSKIQGKFQAPPE